MPSRSTTVTSRAVLGRDECRLVAGRAAADDHDAGHARTSSCSRRLRSGTPAMCPAATVTAARAGRACVRASSACLSCRCTPPTGRTWIRTQMMERAPHSPMAGTGWLQGWRLTFGGEDIALGGRAGHRRRGPAVDRCSSCSTTCPDHDERSLDRWEGGELGLHKKIRLRVHTLERRRAGLALRARRVRGRLTLGPLPRGDRRRRREGRRPRRLRGRTAQPPEPQVV